jgi:hypothetical protein
MITAALLLLVAQEAHLFEKAPPHIDEALRARVSKFYQFHVERKFFQANALVAKESQEEFFNADKQECKAFQIIRIVYEDDFNKARVVVSCDIDMMAGPRLVASKRPLATNWKVIDGEWFWYHIPVDPKAGRLTPFGMMNSGPGTGPAPGAIPTEEAARDLAERIKSAIKPSSSEVMLSSYEDSSAEVTLTNTMGRASLELDPPAIEGLTATLDVTELRTRESARLALKYSPPNKSPKPTQVVRVRVFPSGQVVEITLKFAVPPEVQKLLPKIN